MSGNPKGRRNGSRPAALLKLDALAAHDAVALLRQVLDRALAGDARAGEVVLARIWPVPRGRLVRLDLPRLDGPGGHVAALQRLVEAAAAGEVTPEEAAAMSGLIERHAGLSQLAALEARLGALEAAQGGWP